MIDVVESIAFLETRFEGVDLSKGEVMARVINIAYDLIRDS